MKKEEIKKEEALTEKWELEEVTSKELEMLAEELLSGCGHACGGHVGRGRDL